MPPSDDVPPCQARLLVHLATGLDGLPGGATVGAMLVSLYPAQRLSERVRAAPIPLGRIEPGDNRHDRGSQVGMTPARLIVRDLPAAAPTSLTRPTARSMQSSGESPR